MGSHVIRRRSSVVEHSIGNGEAESSILSGGTIKKATLAVAFLMCVEEAAGADRCRRFTGGGEYA